MFILCCYKTAKEYYDYNLTKYKASTSNGEAITKMMFSTRRPYAGTMDKKMHPNVCLQIMLESHLNAASHIRSGAFPCNVSQRTLSIRSLTAPLTRHITWILTTLFSR